MNLVLCATAPLVLIVGLSAVGQEAPPSTPTPLSQLLAEAEANSPQISAADHLARAARQMAPQVATLPDPKLTYQQLSVGSPKPFAGYTDSNFSYIGLGVSQELPYPGKLRLRGQVAERNADTTQAEVGVTKSSVADSIKTDYIEMAYLQQTLGILQQNESVLNRLIQDATAQYRVGRGMQQDVLEAQVNRTRVVREVTMHHRQMGQLQAHLKGVLGREQGTPDIVTEGLAETRMAEASSDLLSMVRRNNPQVQVDTSSVEAQGAQLALQRREGKPDFEVGYIYENTDRKFRDYYMFSLDLRLPRKKRVNAEIAEAQERLIASRRTLDAHLQQQLAEAQQDYVQAASAEELLKEYREGLIPQSDAAYRAALSAFASNREELPHVLTYLTDVLALNLEYASTLEEHEIALAHLESLTGATLR